MIDGGGGSDTVDYSSATQAVVVDLPGHIAIGAQIGTDTLSNMENVRTGSGNDAVAGDGATNVLDGGAGIDTVSYYAVSSGVVLDLAGQTGVDGTSTDTLLNFENANGTGSTTPSPAPRPPTCSTASAASTRSAIISPPRAY